MYLVQFTNFGHYAPTSFASLTEAVEYSKSKCFETTIHLSTGGIAATWSPIGGLRVW